jgi:hypothetical protein
VNAESTRQQAETARPLTSEGFEILTDVVPLSECDRLTHEVAVLHKNEQAAAKSRIGGIRNLLRLSPQIAQLASDRKFKGVLETRLNKAVFPVRALFFDKTAEANWRVPWHQDLMIAVAERIETPGFEGWSVKERVPHVKPPAQVLASMAIIRLHLDDCNESNGALKVIPGSHLNGELDTDAIVQWRSSQSEIICEVPRGGVLLMHPLLLHSSSPAWQPSHRRIIHIEYATGELPNGLRWFDC